jgi:adenylylsulfate kinase
MSKGKSENVTWHRTLVSQADRRGLLKQSGCVVWLTGLSGSGKSTVACGLEKALVDAGHAAYILDGDNIRHGLNGDLGFSAEDRTENIRRIGHVAHLFADAGLVAITAFISPYRADRQAVRAMVPEDKFIEVHVDADVSVCEQRDPKGLYRKARAGEIRNFTGIDAPYEAPEHPELQIRTDSCSVEQCVEQILAALGERNLIDTEENREDGREGQKA